MRNMNAVEMKRNCIDCGREFTISPYQQMYYANRGWELPRRCRACSEKKRQERQKKEAEGATGQFEKELSDSPETKSQGLFHQIHKEVTFCGLPHGADA